MPYFFGRTHSVRTRLDSAEQEAGSRERRAPTHEEIARLAYSYWEARERQGGSPQQDWFLAERELRGRNEV